MTPKKQLHPDTEITGGIQTTLIAKTIKTRYDPQALADILSVASAVNEKWSTSPQITLLWQTQPNFATLVLNFKNALITKDTASSLQPSQTQTLRQLDKGIDAAVSEVKIYIQRKFQKANAIAQ